VGNDTNQRKKSTLSEVLKAYSIQKSPMDFNPVMANLKNGFGHVWIASSIEDAQIGFNTHGSSNFYVLCVKAPKCMFCTSMGQAVSFFS